MVVKFTSSHQDKSKSGWSIDEIIDGPKFEMFNGKMEKLYKVRWRFEVWMY
jgi:hypothetical protein